MLDEQIQTALGCQAQIQAKNTKLVLWAALTQSSCTPSGDAMGALTHPLSLGAFGSWQANKPLRRETRKAR